MSTTPMTAALANAGANFIGGLLERWGVAMFRIRVARSPRSYVPLGSRRRGLDQLPGSAARVLRNAVSVDPRPLGLDPPEVGVPVGHVDADAQGPTLVGTDRLAVALEDLATPGVEQPVHAV